MKKVFITIILLYSFVFIYAQDELNNESIEIHKQDSLKVDSYAWTLIEPLGLREKSTIDTLLYNYYHKDLQSH